MKLIEDWKAVLGHAWSLRWAALSTVLSIAQVVVPSLDGLIPDHTFAALSALTAVAAILARLVHQPKMHATESLRDVDFDQEDRA